MNKYCLLVVIVWMLSCGEKKPAEHVSKVQTQAEQTIDKTSLVVLGTVQDAGSPQIGCAKECCADLFENPDHARKVTSLGLIDAENQKTYLFEASPDIGVQLETLTGYGKPGDRPLVDGIFLTHAHIGHYTGLMYLGYEAMDARGIPVYVMPRMKDFLTQNGPWSQLLTRENILLHEIEDNKPMQLSEAIEVTPILVPHRDEYSETVGYRIKGPNKSALFIPDIDKWEKWDTNIIEEVKQVDYAFLDATFFSGKELPNRDMAQIQHPLIIESLERFRELSREEKSKIIFIHFNHTNPVLDPESEEGQTVIEQGFRIAKFKEVFDL